MKQKKVNNSKCKKFPKHLQHLNQQAAGIYWIPIFETLERRGLDVRLVNARYVKNVPGKKAMLPTVNGFNRWIPMVFFEEPFVPKIRYAPCGNMCGRSTLVRNASAHIQHMQKALAQMNLLLHNAVARDFDAFERTSKKTDYPI